ncbi:MAG: hypothetical protein Kow00108_15220 [Calditrichia bacterium]
MKRMIFLSTLIFMLSIQFLFSEYATVSGKSILDTNGVEIQLRGYGLGGWLVPEGYMLHTPGYGSPTSIRNMIVDLIGEEQANIFFEKYEQNYVTQEDINLIAEWGFNSIRLPFHYNKFYDINSGLIKEEGFQIVNDLLSWCKEAGLYLILDMHCAPGGQNKYNISDSDGLEARLWTDRNNQLAALEIWKEIARRYSHEKAILGYDLINEPVLPDGYSNQVLYDFYKELTDSIRTVDTNHILFIEGNWFATDFGLLTPPYDSLWVYSFHKYWNATDQGSIQYLLNIRNNFNVPLWMGESGENSNTWFYETVSMYERLGIGWCWWAHKKVATTTSPLSVKINPGYQAILDYWNNNGPKPSTMNAINWLMELADNLKLEHCDFRPGVIASLMDPDFANIAKPYKDHSIPGVISATDYDIGNNGVSYVDRDYKNTSGSPNNAWNIGAQYRNDGVDIEPCQDSQGNGYNVGWIEGGEMLSYTVQIAESAIYRVKFRVASMNSGGYLQLLIDNNQVLGTVTINSTGGWQEWVEVQLDSVELPEGQHKIILFTPNGGFNLNTIEFNFIASTVSGGKESLLRTFHIDSVYPNPFNPVTTIRYYLPNSEKIKLQVTNIKGQQVEILVNNQLMPTGYHQYVWDASSLPSGIYFVQLWASNKILDNRKIILVK